MITPKITPHNLMRKEALIYFNEISDLHKCLIINYLILYDALL